jgi:hypothetical protein
LRAAIAVMLLWAATQPLATTQAAPPPGIFQIEANEFWLNLHHFLYVLGRAESKFPDAARAAVVGAPAESTRGLASLGEEGRRAWTDAITTYANGLSQRDAVLDRQLTSIGLALASARDAPTLAGVSMDSNIRATLERVAPIYRETWWPAHRAANQAWQLATEALLRLHGTTVLAVVTSALGADWPATGYPLHVVAYANWAGSYSTGDGLVAVSSVDKGTQGLYALEQAFHEAMHQWDGLMLDRLQREARKINATVPRDLSHALIFFTAGYAVQQVAPDHVPYGEAFSVWPQRLSGASLPAERLRPILEAVWRPHLEGRTSLDDALAGLIAGTAERLH